MKKFLLSAVVVGIAINIFGQSLELKLPGEMPREQIIRHSAFTLSYNSSYVMPSWLAYLVTNSKVDKSKEPKGKYKADPMVEARPAEKKDYKDAGYIMAQFINAYDAGSNSDAVKETFYLTNITPMKLAFYTHVWLKTEDLIRLWADGKQGFEIITGPVLADAPFPTIGKNKVSVPSRFYKIVYDPVNQKAIAFLFKNGSTSGTLKFYAVPVAEIEKITGINFFPQMDEAAKSELESSVDYAFWDFTLEKNL